MYWKECSKLGRVLSRYNLPLIFRLQSTSSPNRSGVLTESEVTVDNKSFLRDEFTNLTPGMIKKIGRNLHNQKHHPIYLIRSRIQDFFYKRFVGRSGNPLFAVFDNQSPVVSLEQNFDSLLVPEDHPSRHPKDSYYVNKTHMLRAHMTCHDVDVMKAGLDRFLIVGDVYRRDTVDRTHYPVFHQMDGVRLFGSEELFQRPDNELVLLEHGERTPHKQERHTTDTAELLTLDLKNTLVNLTHSLFGMDVEYRWTEEYFPFTHPSWELEIFYEGEWMEVLGCGVLEQQILTNCGVTNKAGWAFGLGLERLAMKLYSIPDVRLFWSADSGFLKQFMVDNCHTPITYKEVSRYPPLAQDISFWLPGGSEIYSSNDFYDLVRQVGGDLIESVEPIDTFTHPNTGRISHAYRVTYRHMHRNLTTSEINEVQSTLRDQVGKLLGCEVRA